MLSSLLMALVAVSGTAPVEVPRGRSILLDNRCEAAEWSDAVQRELGGGVRLALKHDTRFFYFCAMPPAGSLATIDVYLQHGDDAPWNLHASAQLGEKQRGADGWPAAWSWGNQHGWYSPAVPFRGVRDGRGQFGAVDAREFQISRERFAGGEWRWMFELHALGVQQDASIVHPEAAKPDDTESWSVLRFAE